MASVVDRVDHLTDVYSAKAISQCEHLAKQNEADASQWDMYVSPLMGENISKSIFGGSGALPENNFLSDDLFVTAEKEYQSYKDIT
mmetsp:Transcript_597/g.783  ORF Transcript_597/g.783 Transcript_597/m.783 type:complete len:86 (+) Transcript_597:165-422(+)